MRTAVSIELMHNAMLIHDDIEDESEQRRGRPTLHVDRRRPDRDQRRRHALAAVACARCSTTGACSGTELSLRILEETERMARESAEGQALELGWRRDNVTDVAEADYLEMVLKKTCWLATIYPSRVGALIGTRGAVDLDRFIRFGFFLGAAFQIQDDLLNLVGDADALRQGARRRHLRGQAHADADPPVRAGDASASAARLRALLGQPRAERTRRRRALGARAHGRATAASSTRARSRTGLAGAARHEFTLLFGGLPDSRDKRFIEALPTWVIERD